jgi:hypothetical protein
VIANYLDDSIRDIANAAALSSTLDEFSVCLKDAKRGAKLNSFSIYYPKGLFSAERKTGKAVPLHP